MGAGNDPLGGRPPFFLFKEAAKVPDNEEGKKKRKEV